MSNNDDEVKLTTDNITTDGVSFPDTPKPQVITETFASYTLNNNQNNNPNNNEE